MNLNRWTFKPPHTFFDYINSITKRSHYQGRTSGWNIDVFLVGLRSINDCCFVPVVCLLLVAVRFYHHRIVWLECDMYVCLYLHTSCAVCVCARYNVMHVSWAHTHRQWNTRLRIKVAINTPCRPCLSNCSTSRCSTVCLRVRVCACVTTKTHLFGAETYSYNVCISFGPVRAIASLSLRGLSSRTGFYDGTQP